jgi:hypothetical protein
VPLQLACGIAGEHSCKGHVSACEVQSKQKVVTMGRCLTSSHTIMFKNVPVEFVFVGYWKYFTSWFCAFVKRYHALALAVALMPLPGIYGLQHHTVFAF